MKETKIAKGFNEIEFWGRCLIVSMVLALTTQWNTNWFGWVFWVVIAIVLGFWIKSSRKWEK